MIKYKTMTETLASPEGKALYTQIEHICKEAQKLIPESSKPQFFGSQAYIEQQTWLILNNLTQFVLK